MEAIPWLIAGLCGAWLCVFALCCGVFFGCIFHWHASIFYARNADDAIARARERAYADHLAKLEEAKRKQDDLSAQEIPQDRDEAEENFEQSLQTIFPNDPKIQETLKKQRRDKVQG